MSRGDANRLGSDPRKGHPVSGHAPQGVGGSSDRAEISWRLGVSRVIDEFVHTGADVFDVTVFLKPFQPLVDVLTSDI